MIGFTRGVAMSIRINFNADQVGKTFLYGIRRLPAIVKQAADETAAEAAEAIKEKGDADISGAGRFGSRWTDSFKAEVSTDRERVLISVYSTIPYFSIFEFGGTIKGNPLLWIPLSPEYGGDAMGINARDYGALFKVPNKRTPNARAGKAPLLLSYSDRQPKYFGKEQVTIPRKFSIREICREEANKVPGIFREKKAAAAQG